MSRILKISDDKDILFSIHNQETNNENKLFLNKEGDLCDWLKSIKASPEIWHKRDASDSFFKEFKTKKDILLVHNTYTSKQEITDNYYCTCPKANLFIEQKIPDYSIFNIDRLCVGTDSLASNDSLSIMSELSIIQKNSDFTLQELLKIACKNGAKALGFKDLGTFEIGKNPGVNLISNFALGLEKSDLKKII
jgi:cytosine/adenosine deaminase-related metal-dependent hydrolase